MKSGVHAALQKFVNGLAAAFAIAQRPFVHVHADKFVGHLRFHVSRELHGVIDRGFAMIERIGHALMNGAPDLQANRSPERAPHGVPAQRQRQPGLLDPPLSQVDHLVQSHLRKIQLPLMNQ